MNGTSVHIASRY